MDQKTIDTYNQMAKEYDDDTTDFWDKFPRTFFDKFVETAKSRILDIGSGPGREGLILKERGLEVICVDASEEMVRLSSEKGLESIVGDFMNLPFPNKSFDSVWAYTSLLHIPKADINKALGEITKILKEGGILGLGLIEGETEGYQETSGINMPRWFSFYKKEEVESLLKGHGFKILYFESFKLGSKSYLNFIAKKV